MSVIRVNKNKDYTVMSNYHFRDKNLSLKAKGLLSQMLSLPKTWDYSVEGLVAINKESKTAIQNTLKELEQYGYLVRTKTHDKQGRIDYIYDVYETPHEETPQTENPVTVNPCTDNMSQLNTKESITEELNTKDKKKERKKEKNHNYDEQIEEYTENEELKNAIRAFIQMRAMIKKPLTEYAMKLMLNNLDKLANDDNTKIAILNQSIMHNWQGVFPLKGDSNYKMQTQARPEKQEEPETPKAPDYNDYFDENGNFDGDGYNKALAEYKKIVLGSYE